jgi:AcrR family transcriptional regulator
MLAMPLRTPEYMEDRRESILAAAMDCLERNGLNDTSLTDICSAAGISRGALYIHFESKDQILQAVARKLSNIGVGQLAFESRAALQEALVSQVRMVLDSGMKTLGKLELDLMMASHTNEVLHESLRAAVAARNKALEDGLRKLVKAGELRRGLDVAAAAHAINAFMIGLFNVAHAARTPVEMHIAALRLVLDGMFGPPARRR